jgi:hypothetical protein
MWNIGDCAQPCRCASVHRVFCAPMGHPSGIKLRFCHCVIRIFHIMVLVSCRCHQHSLPQYTYIVFVPLFIRGPSTSTHFPGCAAMNFYLGPRRSTATASSSSTNTTAATPVKDDFPEALTYRFNDNSAWVPAARTHEASIRPTPISPLFRLST